MNNVSAKSSEIKNKNRIVPAMLLSGMAVFFYILYRFDPVKDMLYPVCWFYELTGKLCPGCGGLRGTHAFLNGNILLSLAYNPLLALFFSVTAYFVVFNAIALVKGQYPKNYLNNKLFIYFLVLIIIIFWIVRNLNWFMPEFPGNY